MWPAYIHATHACLPHADEKICFDRFHVSKHLGDKVRRQEHKELRKSGNEMLTGSKYMWLKRPPNLSMKHGIPCAPYPYRPSLGDQGNGSKSMA